MCDEGKESGSLLFLGWESDFKLQKHLRFLLVLLPLNTGAAGSWLQDRPAFRAQGWVAGDSERTAEKCGLDIIFHSVHSFARLHSTLHHRGRINMAERTCYVSGTELDIVQNYFSDHRHGKSVIKYSGVSACV